MDAICAEVSDNGIEKALNRVPKDMDATYERILNTINAKPHPQRELARKALIWIAYSRRPLPIHALAFAISTEMATVTTSLEDLESSIPSEGSILDACANLISIDQSENRYTQFVHFSVQEFLTSHHSTVLHMGHEVGHRELARVCMIFLNLCSTTVNSTRSDFLSTSTSVKWLYQYALDEWPHHLLAGNLSSLADDPIITLAFSFFENGPVLLTEQSVALGGYWGRRKQKTYLRFSPSVLALIFDLPGIQDSRSSYAKQSEEEIYNYDCDSPCKVLSNDQLAIHYATAELDSIAVVRRLYNRGYALNYSYSDPEGKQSSKVQEWLLVSPLHSAQSIQMAQYLLENGISIEPQYLGDTFADPLKCFAQKEGWGVEGFQLLLDRVVERNGGRLTDALQAAAYHGNIEVIQLLLDNGVNINARGGEYGYALQAAAWVGRVKVIQLLLDKGANVNAQGGEYGNALQAATYNGKIEVILLLLDRGADVNAQGGEYGNALQAAARVAGVQVIQLLLDKRANINAPGGRYGNALQAAAAAYHGKIEVIQLLLDNGADVNAQGGKYGSALQAAVWMGKVEVIRLLLDKGADINARGGYYGSALQAAAHNGDIEIIQLLLDKGADINPQGGMFGTVLQAAAFGAKIQVIHLLLDKGVDVNTQGGMFGTALQAAAYSGSIEAIQLLLDKGAHINARAGKYGDALKKMLALKPGSPECRVPGDVTLLVELLQDHAPIFLDHLRSIPEHSYRRIIEKQILNEERCSIDVFKRILESRGWEGDAQGSKQEESGNEREPYRTESESENSTEDENGTLQELQKRLLRAPNESSLEATVCMRKLFGFVVLVFLLYILIDFGGA